MGPGSIFQDETTVDEPGETVRYFRSDGPGYTTVNVRAFDENGAPSDLFEVSIVIVEEVVIVDADGDGYPSGLTATMVTQTFDRVRQRFVATASIKIARVLMFSKRLVTLMVTVSLPLKATVTTPIDVSFRAFERCNDCDDNCAGGGG